MNSMQILKFRNLSILLLATTLTAPLPIHGAAKAAGGGDLVVAEHGRSEAVIVVSPGALRWEKRAATDLARSIGLMSGVMPAVADTPETIAAALASKKPLLIIGQEALKASPSLQATLDRVAKKNPILHADAIALRREGNRVYLAGTDEDCHYFAVVTLLNQWGCRWYMPTEFGECIPDQPTLKIGRLDVAYAPPFEVRNYWISRNGAQTGVEEFQRRNMMNSQTVRANQMLVLYAEELFAPGKEGRVPISAESTAAQVAQKVAPMFATGENINLGVAELIFQSQSPADVGLNAGIQDKHFMADSMSDPFMVLYNNVADILQKQFPNSKSKIGILSQANATIPPQRQIAAAKSLVMTLTPINVDPIHGMDDPRAPSRQEYKKMVYRWSEIMDGRLIIGDRDQGMLIWRDLPNPSIQSLRQDIKHYRKAGVLGMSTETFSAFGTTFINLHLRAQLLWNPDADPDAMMAEFYQKFYGPAAKPMAEYWSLIHRAWADTLATEHENFIAPAIYTPELAEQLRKPLEAAEKLVKPLVTKPNPSRNEKLVWERIRFTRLSFGVIESYTAMVTSAARDVDYKAAIAAGEKGLAYRRELTDMNDIFTTRLGAEELTPPLAPTTWTGEMAQYRDLAPYTDGTKGALLLKTPLEWAFRRDPNDTGVMSGWAYEPVDLAHWNKVKNRGPVDSHLQSEGNWEMLRTDLYMQAQGVLHPDYQSFTGFAWYRTDIELDASQAGGKVHIRFPGIFNESWLYVNGYLVAHRKQDAMWWMNDYKFEWDVDLSGKLKAGKNTITVRLNCQNHFGGIFRRPFLYTAAGK